MYDNVDDDADAGNYDCNDDDDVHKADPSDLQVQQRGGCGLAGSRNQPQPAPHPR